MPPVGFPHWKTMYLSIPKAVRDALWQLAPTASPQDGIRGVPQTWAAIAYWHGQIVAG